MNVAPYLFFNGRCEEAIDFYKSALGANVEMMMRFSDAPACEGAPPPAAPPEKIMHVAFKVGGTRLMASDGMCSGEAPKFSGCSLSLEVPDVATAEKMFGALADGGQVQQPLIETFFAPRFGMVADKFGVGWMVVAAASPAA